MGPWFSWLLGVAASTKPDFGFLLTLNVKNMMYLGDGDIWLELVESFSNLGLHFSRELLTVEPARRGTGHQTILKSSNKALKSNARTHPSSRHTSSLVLIKQNHQWVPTPGGRKTPSCLLSDEHGKWKFVWLHSKRQQGLGIGRREGGVGNLIPGD